MLFASVFEKLFSHIKTSSICTKLNVKVELIQLVSHEDLFSPRGNGQIGNPELDALNMISICHSVIFLRYITPTLQLTLLHILG